MAFSQIWISAFLVCCALNQGLSAPTDVFNFVTITPEPDQATPEPCPPVPCPAPYPGPCSQYETTYFEWEGMMCPGCIICVIEPSTEATIG